MELRNRNFSFFNCLLFHFSAFFHIFHIFRIFSHFQNTFFHIFSCAFSKRIFFAFFQEKCEKCAKKMRFENALGKNVKQMRFENALGKNVKKNVQKMWKNANIWKSSWEGGTLIFFFRFDFLGSSFAAVTLLPAQLLQVENRRGAVQIDRKWTVQIADLFNLSIAKQWLPGAKT